MKPRLLELICCPACAGDLRIEAVMESRKEIEEAVILCGQCQRDYPVIGGIPRLLPDPLIHQVKGFHPDFFKRHGGRLSRYLSRSVPVPADGGWSSKQKTLTSYSYQWRRFKIMLPHWEQVFRDSIDPIEPGFFRGKVGLDAGCGFGRSLHYAAAYGAEVIGLDLSEAVESARENTRGFPKVHVVQADLTQPPIRDHSMDFIYSIGVLDHLPDPSGGFSALTPKLAAGAPIFIWVYSRGRGRQIRFLNVLRALSTRLPMPLLDGIAWGIAALQWFFWIVPYRLLLHFLATRALTKRMPFTWHAQYPFGVLHTDWVDGLSVPLQEYYRPEEIHAWFRDAGLKRIQLADDWGKAGGGRALGYRPARHAEEVPVPS